MLYNIHIGQKNTSIVIASKAFRTRWWRKRLVKYGFRYRQTTGQWVNSGPTKPVYRFAKSLARFGKLECLVYQPGYCRSADYRLQYLRYWGERFYQSKGRVFDAEKDKVRCVYCGVRLRGAEMQVDHVIPVHAVQDIRCRDRYITRLNRKEIYNINDVRNLVFACPQCNAAKRASVGFWPMRAAFGSLPWFHPLVRCIVVLGGLAFALGMFWACTHVTTVVDFLRSLSQN